MSVSTTNDLLTLTLPYADFKREIESFITEAAVLHGEEIKTHEQLTSLQKQTKDWENKVLLFLETSFSDINNYMKREFYQTQAPYYQIPGMQRTFVQELDWLKKTIAEKQLYLWFNLRIIEVSEAIIEPEKINFEERAIYSTDQKLSVLLEKLYELYDDYYYPAKEILIGNGVVLKRNNEEYELSKMLEDRGWVEFNNLPGCTVRLTAEGNLFVEQQKQEQKNDNKNMETKTGNMMFISHGGSHLWKDVARFIEKELGIETIILQERPNKGRTVIEKLEEETKECNFAIIVMTAEDEQKDGVFRARQNVIHEIGFCQGVFGRENVLVLKQKGAEGFTNISGIVYEEFIGDNIKSTFEKIRQEIAIINK